MTEEQKNKLRGYKKYNMSLFGVFAGLLFIFAGAALLYAFLIKPKWVTYEGKVLIPCLLSSVFVLAGLAVTIFSAIQYSTWRKLKNAVLNNAKEEELFILEDKIKRQIKLEIEAMSSAVPFILLVPFVWLFVYGIQTHISIGKLIVIGAGAAFLLLVCYALTIGRIITNRKFRIRVENAQEETKLIGKLEKIYLAPVIYSNNSEVSIDQYQVEISYYLDGQHNKFVTSSTFSKRQIDFMNKLEFIPVIIKGGKIDVDMESFYKTPKALHYEPIDYTGIKRLSTEYQNQQAKNNDSTTKKKHHLSLQLIIEGTIAMTIMAFTGTVFLIVGIALLKSKGTNGGSSYIPLIVVGSLLLLFAFIYIVRTLIGVVTEKKGTKCLASSFKLKARTNSDSNHTTYGIEWTVENDQGITRKYSQGYLRVSPFFFTEYDIKKLPIKVYKRHSVVDYKTLIEMADKKDNQR